MRSTVNPSFASPAIPGRLAPATLVFTQAERAALRQLRVRYRAGHDVFDAREMARLRFIRWLYQTGHLAA